MELTFTSLDELRDFWSQLHARVTMLSAIHLTEEQVAEQVAEKLAHMAYCGDFTKPGKIEAIRQYANWFHCSLKEAKTAIEKTSYYRSTTN